jgi:hypothetical protein
MMSLLFCLLAPSAPPDQVLDRYAALRGKAPAIEMAYTTGPLASTLLFVPERRMRLEAKAPGVDYLCVITERGMNELDRTDHEYDENTEVQQPGPPPSRISGASAAFPRWILLKDFRKMFPSAKFVGLGRRKVGGTEGDVVRTTIRDEAEGAVHNVELVIDDAGIPRYVLLTGQSRMGGYRSEYKVSRFESRPVPADSRFAFTIPDGYSPYSLDFVPGPAGVGATLPLTGWRAANGGDLNLGDRLKNGGLVAIWGADSEPSRRSAASLGRIRAAGVPVVIVADAAMPGADGYDSDGKILDKLGIPASPVFYRVDGAGKITAAWMGYDAANAAEFEREVTGR